MSCAYSSHHPLHACLASEPDVITLANRYNELSSRPDGSSELDVENDYEEVPAALNHLKSVVGKCFTHRVVTYKVIACLTATEDVEPVYELHHGDSEKKYVSLSDLEMMMSES